MLQRANIGGVKDRMEAGDWDSAIALIGGSTSQADLAADVKDGVMLGIGRRAFGKLPIIKGKKYGISVF
ncbi:MAG: hypothetical protein GY941_22745 [Planctomycetes bacterium]|nr:hypothetical protein [Planctomycetota bacterium]